MSEAHHDHEHIALCVAAGLAYWQCMMPERPRFYDPQHFSEVLTRTAQALIAVTRVHVRSGIEGQRRQLTDQDLAGAEVRRGATLLVLADGRSYSGVTLLRADLRATIGALKAAKFPLGV